jgi:hypothetical protein
MERHERPARVERAVDVGGSVTDPITHLVLREQEAQNTTYRWMARVDGSGDLRLEGRDRGERVEAAWGHPAYDYTRVVGARYRDTVLLWLLKERFESDGALGGWLDAKGIPSEVESTAHGD